MTDSKPTIEEETVDESLKSSLFKATIGLALFAIVTAGLIALTQVSTKDRIAEEIKKASSKALLEIVPRDTHDNDMLADAFWVNSDALGLDDESEAFVAKQDGKITAVILPVVAPEGYTGPISMVMGIDINGNIKGVRVLDHRETPGLGDKIELKKSDWVLGFDGHSLDSLSQELWAVKKDGGHFDQLTGATITPRAIVSALYKALTFYQTNATAILDTPPGQVLSLSETGDQ